MAGLVAWGLFGTITTDVVTHGARLGGETVVFLTTDEVEKVHVGDAVTAGDTDFKVAEISDVPISRDEARGVVGSDYLLKTLVADDWVYVARLTGEGADALPSGKPLAMRIECERTAPLSVIFGRRAGE